MGWESYILGRMPMNTKYRKNMSRSWKYTVFRKYLVIPLMTKCQEEYCTECSILTVPWSECEVVSRSCAVVWSVPADCHSDSAPTRPFRAVSSPFPRSWVYLLYKVVWIWPKFSFRQMTNSWIRARAVWPNGRTTGISESGGNILSPRLWQSDLRVKK